MQVAVVRLRGDQNALGLLPCLLASAMLGSNGATVQCSPIRKVRRISGSHGRTAKNNPNSNRSEIIVIASAKPYGSPFIWRKRRSRLATCKCHHTERFLLYYLSFLHSCSSLGVEAKSSSELLFYDLNLYRHPAGPGGC